MTNTFVDHCETVYNALDERAVNKLVNDDENEDSVQRVFTGAVAEVYKRSGVSQTYYGPIFKTLEDVGAILKLQKGGRDADTVIILNGLPKEWPAGLGWKGRNNNPLTNDTRYDTLRLDVDRLQEITGGINVIAALADFEKRITAIETATGVIKEEGAPHGKAKRTTKQSKPTSNTT